MSLQLEKNDEKLLSFDANYKDFFNNVKERLRTAQIRASLAANKELITFYWQLGVDIIEQQKKYQWGESFLEQFSNDMRRNFPAMEGFSVTNLKRMRRVALH